MAATVYYRGCTKHVNPDPKRIRPSTACPVCVGNEKDAGARIGSRMDRILTRKKRKNRG